MNDSGTVGIKKKSAQAPELKLYETREKKALGDKVKYQRR
jgi:hypothetical protein